MHDSSRVPRNCILQAIDRISRAHVLDSRAAFNRFTLIAVNSNDPRLMVYAAAARVLSGMNRSPGGNPYYGKPIAFRVSSSATIHD